MNSGAPSPSMSFNNMNSQIIVSVTVWASQRRDAPVGFTYSTAGRWKIVFRMFGHPSPVKSYAHCSPLKYCEPGSMVRCRVRQASS